MHFQWEGLNTAVTSPVHLLGGSLKVILPVAPHFTEAWTAWSVCMSSVTLVHRAKMVGRNDMRVAQATLCKTGAPDPTGTGRNPQFAVTLQITKLRCC